MLKTTLWNSILARELVEELIDVYRRIGVENNEKWAMIAKWRMAVEGLLWELIY